MKNFKFFIVGLLLIIIVIFLMFPTKKEQNKTIKVAEVTHSVFYTPFYVAIEKGFFKEEGLDIELIVTPGADKVSAAVLSKDVQIGLAGTESAIYIYEKNKNDYLQVFAGLTKRDGQFIMGRKKNDDFSLKDLKGKEILVGRKGGMPSLNFLNALKNEGINPEDININYSIDFASLSGTFIGGIGDYVNLFEPNATLLEKEGYAYPLISIGELSGSMPYTAFYAKKSFIKDHEESIKSFNRAINKALNYTRNTDNKTIANDIVKQFPDTSLSDLEKIITRYKQSDAWLNNTNISEELFKNLEDIMIDNDLLEKYVPYKDLIKNYD